MIFEYLREPSLEDLLPSRDAFKYLERGMKCVGWIPPPKEKLYYWAYRFWSVVVFSLGGIYTQVGLYATYIFDFDSFTVNTFLSSIQSVPDATTVPLKVLTLLPNIWRFHKAWDLLDLMDKRCTRMEERFEVHRCVVRCNTAFIIYTAVYSIFLTLTYLSSVLMGSTPWGFYNPFIDYRSSPQNLWIACTFEYFVGSAASYLDEMADLYPLMFGLILRTHIKLLTERINRLRTNSDETEDQSYEELVNCCKDYKLIVEFCNNFRPIISVTIFLQFISIGVCLGLTLFNLLFFATFWIGLATIAFIILLVFQTFPFCYVCDLVEKDCEMLSIAIFQSNWVDADKRYKQSLIYFLHRTQQPINIKAGGKFKICLQTNIEMAKIAFSVITFAKQLNIMDKLQAN
ncbi:GH16278 [Drosophila grimshawi]|uniref:Odorant receptor n=1 Tax=Drosophila grimshawi TaxID=7222 RepID=B4IXY1_DROGR|nr:GH16278 [Drosophila grimshawi]